MTVRRRDFITLLGGAATWPLAARAQQPALPVIGYLYSGTAVAGAPNVAAFRKGLGEAGQVEGRDVAIETRWGENDRGRLPALAAELVRRRVALIVATPISSALPAKAATTTIPILFQTGSDPVRAGLVASFSRPGGNLTGVSQLSTPLAAKRLALLHELVPNVSAIGVLVVPGAANSDEQLGDLQQAARALGLRPPIVVNGRELDSAFAGLAQQQIGAIFVAASPYFYGVRDQIALLAARHSVPVIYESREFPEAGGLISYGVDFSDVYRQLGVYAGKILKGAKPADLPVVQPTKFELVINLRSAKVIGLTVPQSLLVAADQVIE
jgi:putative tryptophan/tyrosine transport system substrate-binding protein